MAENNEMMEVIATTTNEVAKKSNNTGTILVVAGFVGGIALTVGVTEGVKYIKKKKSDRKAKKAEMVVASAE